MQDSNQQNRHCQTFSFERETIAKVPGSLYYLDTDNSLDYVKDRYFNINIYERSGLFQYTQVLLATIDNNYHVDVNTINKY